MASIESQVAILTTAQQQTILSAVVVSSNTTWCGQPITQNERRRAFDTLQEFSSNTSCTIRMALCVQWLQIPQLTVANGTIDCTISGKLYACEILSSCLNNKTKKYAKWPEGDRLQLRNAVMVAAKHQAVAPLINAKDGSKSSSTITTSIPLAKKLASLLAALMVRDFPQRWTTCIQDLFQQLWSETAPLVGNRICLQVLQLVCEDCTDSDFNSKISTRRRNDILMGLNEVSHIFLPLLFRSLELITFLSQGKASIHQMRLYLLQNQQRVSTMTPEQSAAYLAEEAKIKGTSLVIADTLQCVSIFCRSMPTEWVMSSQHDFVSALFHLMRESTENINVKAVGCLEQITLRGKLSYSSWLQWIQDLPNAVQQANQHTSQETEYLKVQEAAITGNQTFDAIVLAEPLSRQLDFHRALSRMLSSVVSSHIGLITKDKSLLGTSDKKTNKNAAAFAAYLRLLVDILHHPSGRVVGEQINLWVSMLRDPQISKSSHTLDPLVTEILNCFANHMVKLEWDDIIENGTHPHSELFQASWEDEDDYETWSHEYRAKSSQLFKYLGNCYPSTSSSFLLARISKLIEHHGNGEPFDHVCSTNKQLLVKSMATRQFEGIVLPMENILSGIPPWSLNTQGKSVNTGPETGLGRKQQQNRRQRESQIRSHTQSSLSQLGSRVVSWNPLYLWLRFRRAQMLECLKHYWKYDPSTLLQGVNSLLLYIGIPDEWGGTKIEEDGTTLLSGETVGLKKRSSMALVGISKVVPHHLVPHLSELSNASRSLLSFPGLLQTNRMNLYEFLSVVATSVESPIERANFITSVLGDALNTLQSSETQEALASVDNFATAVGVTQASSNPASVTNISNVKIVIDRFARIFSAFNQLLSVGKRCHEAAKKRPNSNRATNSSIPKGMSIVEAAETLNFPDEGPISINDLSIDDGFVQLWPRIMPHMLRMLDIIFKLWRPQYQALFLRDPIQRYALAISDDDAFMARKNEGKNGGVFGEGGTCGSIIPGTDRREMNLVPRWSGWFNELRICLFQMLGLVAGQRVLYCPEISSEFYPQLVAIVTDRDNLRAMEHRHCTQYLKQFIEVLLLSCPPTLYLSHLTPIVGPVFEHIQFRLEKSWEPVINSLACKPLFVDDCEAAATIASHNNEAWYTSYYARSGLFVGSLDCETAEACVEKHRVEVTRTWSDVIQTALALKGEWALVLANLVKEDEGKSSNLKKGPPTTRLLVADGAKVNADGTPRAVNQAALDARRLKRINALNHYLFLENETAAGYLVVTVIQSLSYPDTYTCRRITRICHRILETVSWHPRYTDLLGRRMFAAIVKDIITEPKWMVGVEWDVINVFRDIFCRLVLGQILQMGGQGPGLQQNIGISSFNGESRRFPVYEQAKSAEKPLQGGGILTTPSELPHQLLSSLPGISVAMIQQLDQDMKTKRSAKAQKDLIRDFLRVAADEWKQVEHSNKANRIDNISGSTPGILDRAVAEESLLHNCSKVIVVEDIPEQLVLSNRKSRADRVNEDAQGNVGLSSFRLTI